LPRWLLGVKCSAMKPKGLVAVLQFALLLPAALFMFALFARSAFAPATEAEQLVLWYSARMWTLWLLLLALPLAAFGAGAAMLVRSESFAVVRAHFGILCVAAMEVAAAGILAIVVLHMAAN
jgi:hypothetical protein